MTILPLTTQSARPVERQCSTSRVHRRTCVGLALSLALLLGGRAADCAEVRVHGDLAALRIEVVNSQVAEVLSAVGATLPVHVTTPIALDKVIDGSYAGSLGQVLARVLDGYSYVTIPRQATTEIVVIGPKGARAVVAVDSASPSPPRSLAAEWRRPINSEGIGIR